jgi:hypothetical protein
MVVPKGFEGMPVECVKCGEETLVPKRNREDSIQSDPNKVLQVPEPPRAPVAYALPLPVAGQLENPGAEEELTNAQYLEQYAEMARGAAEESSSRYSSSRGSTGDGVDTTQWMTLYADTMSRESLFGSTEEAQENPKEELPRNLTWLAPIVAVLFLVSLRESPDGPIDALRYIGTIYFGSWIVWYLCVRHNHILEERRRIEESGCLIPALIYLVIGTFILLAMAR